ncbi:MAG: hypothetical protein JWL77_6028 [Chthonomonadaceae bacterium]|nr:hypothetical protein [Chthonomonadaceae bacterium]
MPGSERKCINMANLITGLFETEAGAEVAVAHLKEIGYTENEISVIMKDRRAGEEFAIATGATTMEGVGTGAAIGGTIGAVLGLLAIGSIAIPGVGLLVAGPLAGMLAGAGAFGLAGGLLGWLVGVGIPEDVAPYYERGLSTGGVVVVVATHPEDDARVHDILNSQAAAYSAPNMPSFIAPTYAARHADLSIPVKKTYDEPTTSAYQTAQQTNHEAVRTINATGAEQRSAERTAAEHEREARRDDTGFGILNRTGAALENEADRIKTAVQNQSDKAATGTENLEDRIRNQ